MKIRTKLYLIALLPVTLFLMAWAVQAMVEYSIEHANRKMKLADSLHEGFADLHIFALEHSLYVEPGAHNQWAQKYALVGRQLAEARQLFTTPEERQVVDALEQGHRAIGELFTRYASRDRTDRPSLRSALFERTTAGLHRELEQVLPRTLLLQNRNRDLAALYDRRRDIVEFLFLLGLAVGIPFFMVKAYRSLILPIQSLHEGIRIVAAGNLGHRLALPGRDEIAELAAAFDELASRRREAEEALHRLNEDLERRVDERTEELTTLNCELEAEIEERAQAEHARRESESRYELLFENASDGIMILDPHGRILALNRIFCDRLGYRQEELLGKTPRDIDPPEYAPLVEERMRAIHEQGHVIFETAHVHRDGRVMPVEVSSRLVEYDGQQAIMSIVRDISERKRAEEELLRMKEAAEAANRAKSGFLANMSHEIRTPLNAIIGLGFLLRDSELTVTQRDYMEKIEAAARSLLAILNDILDFSKIEAGRMELESVPFRMADLLEGLTPLVAIWSEGKEIRFSVVVGEGVPQTLVGDPLRLTQVLTNLLNNAIKFTKQGEVVITIASRGDGGNGDGVRLVFVVRDTGIGMTEEEQLQLFQPFSQADSSTTRRFGGTGLGLSICKRLVELMGGEIRAVSAPGVGSSFTFTALLARGPADLPEEPAETPPGNLAGLRGKRVLVVEDQAVNQILMHEVLTRVGVETTIAATGHEAVAAMAAGGAFDAVLMDIQMPEMDGYEATRRIRALPGGGQFPIIAMTAHVMAEERERCLAAGMNAHLGKPVQVDRLYTVLLRFVAPRTYAEAATTKEVDRPVSADPPKLPPLPGIDVKVAIDNLDGDADLFQRLLQTFAADKQGALSEIEQALAAQEWRVAERIAHGIKGIAGYLAASGLFRVATGLEQAFEAQDGAAAEALLPEFGECLGEILASARILARACPTPADTSPGEGG